MSTSTESKDNPIKEPSLMEQEINHTRARIGRTVEALEERLSPGQLMDQALGFARDHGGTFASGLANSVRRNPLPVIVTGLGVLWLLKSQMSHSQDSVSPRGRIYTPYDEHDPTYPGAAPWVDPRADLGSGDDAGSVRSTVSEKLSGVGEAIKSRVSSARSSVAQAGNSMGDSLRGARDGLSERSQGTLESARAAGQAVRERVGGASQGALEQARRAKDEFSTLMDEQPLLMGALGIALGATIAALVPATRRERSVMGRASDTVADKASELASEGYESLRETASKSVDKLARSIGNTADSTSSDARSDQKSNAGSGASGSAATGSSGATTGGSWNGQFPTSSSAGTSAKSDDSVRPGGIGR